MTVAAPQEQGVTKFEQDSRVAELEHRLQELRGELAAQHRTNGSPCHNAPQFFPRLLQNFIEMTNEVIPGDVSIESRTDPDDPDTPHIVFRVSAETKPENVNVVIGKEIEWHRRARAIFPAATCYFTLAID